MGIQGLTKLLQDRAPACIKQTKFEQYFGRKVAVDASMHIYQFMVVVGRVGDQLLSNEAGEVRPSGGEGNWRAVCAARGLAWDAAAPPPSAAQVTSHLQGMFFRTVRMLEAGIKPVYVFEGKAPELKRAQLALRSDKREDAEDALKAAQEAGNEEEIEK